MAFETFSGGITYPSDVSYRAVQLTVSVSLSWPTLAENTSDVVARIMEVTPAAGSLAITLPDATLVSNGQDILFRNPGSFSFTVKGFDGTVIATVSSGEAKYFYLTDNSGTAGTWSVIQFGQGTSNADASLLAGLGLKAITTTINQKHDVVEVTNDITIAASDRAKNYVFTSGTRVLTLPTATSVGSDFFFIAKNAGNGTVTITPSGADTVDAAASQQLSPNDGVILYSGGNSNKWYTVAMSRAVNFAFTQLVKNVTGGTDIALTSSELANKIITFTGALTASINVTLSNTVSVYYVFNNTSGAFSLTVKTATGSGVAVTQGAREIVVCDGTDIRRGVDNTSATTLFSSGSESGPSITFVSDNGTGFYRQSAGVPAITGAGTDVMRFVGVTSAVNAIEAVAATTGNPPILRPFGGDANVSLLLAPLGTGQVLANDGDLAVRSTGDVTKKVKFDCSALPTATTRTLTVPNLSGTIAIADTAQTLTNKTLTSPTITGGVLTGTTLDNGAVVCPTGVVLPYAGASAPTGWLLCAGQAVSRGGANANLFALISTTYGVGDGSTTFNLPDLRGRVPAGKDDMTGVAANRLTNSATGGVAGTVLGNSGGEQAHTLLTAELASHVHGVTDAGHTHSYVGSGFTFTGGAGGGAADVQQSRTTGSTASGITINTTGGDAAHNTVQPTIVLNYIIKT